MSSWLVGIAQKPTQVTSIKRYLVKKITYLNNNYCNNTTDDQKQEFHNALVGCNLK